MRVMYSDGYRDSLVFVNSKLRKMIEIVLNV